MKRTRLLLSVLALGAVSAVASAQESTLRAPRIDEPPRAPIFGTFGTLLLLESALIFAATLKPKRTHQD